MCLRNLKLRSIGWRLDNDSPKVKWMRCVYLRVDYTQAPWTVAGTVDDCYA